MSSDEPSSGSVPFTGSDTGLRKLNHFFVFANRHDKDRIEISFDFDGLVPPNMQKFSYELDIAMFVPKSLGVGDFESLEHFRHEFQTNIRLQTHASSLDTDIKIARVRERLKQMRDEFSQKSIHTFAVEYESIVKNRNHFIKKSLNRSGSHPMSIDDVKKELMAFATLLEDFRDLVREKGLWGCLPTQVETEVCKRDILLLNEYVSHVYVQKLVDLKIVAEEKGDLDVVELIEKQCREEAQVRRDFHLAMADVEDPDCLTEENQYLRRIGVLKKHFHKALFVSTTVVTSQRKLLVPVYAVSAAMAALWASALWIYQMKTFDPQAVSFGFGSFAFISFGVLAYVIKDILKDSFRRYFFAKGAKWVADFDRRLFMERFSKRTVLGRILEYLNVMDASALPADLKKVRYSVNGGHMEETIGEDVVHFKKRVTINLKKMGMRKAFPWGLRQIVRYRIDRLTPSMEDSRKDVHWLDSKGHTVTRTEPRQYHVYLAAWIRQTGAENGKAFPMAFKGFLFTLNKEGVVRCTSLKWRKAFGIPSTPPL